MLEFAYGERTDRSSHISLFFFMWIRSIVGREIVDCQLSIVVPLDMYRWDCGFGCSLVTRTFQVE